MAGATVGTGESKAVTDASTARTRGGGPLGLRRSEGRVRKRTRRERKVDPKMILKHVNERQNGDPENVKQVPVLAGAQDEDGDSIQTCTSPPKSTYVSLDCEMVGLPGNRSGLAKCTVLDYEGHVLFDHYIKPCEPITHFRTRWSGVRPYHMKNAVPHHKAVRSIRSLLEGCIIIGHDLVHDFMALGLSHRHYHTRDTAKFVPLRQAAGLCTRQSPSLRNLSAVLLGRQIQRGPHCSLEDAQAALDIYRKYESAWESYILDSRVWLDDQFWPEELCC